VIFLTLDKSDLLKYINLYSQAEDFSDSVRKSNSINSFLSILINNNIILREKIKSYITNVSSAITLLNEDISEMSLAFIRYSAEIEKEIGTEVDPRQHSKYKDIFQLFNSYKEAKYYGNDIKNLKEKFYSPLQEVLLDHRKDPRISGILKCCINALKNLHSIEAERNYFSVSMKKIISLYQDNLTSLPEIISFLGKK
jgi:predicted transcriptional regulator